jgi:hypothetical protein
VFVGQGGQDQVGYEGGGFGSLQTCWGLVSVNEWQGTVDLGCWDIIGEGYIMFEGQEG